MIRRMSLRPGGREITDLDDLLLAVAGHLQGGAHDPATLGVLNVGANLCRSRCRVHGVCAEGT
jgi:hypothetical protein